MVIPVLQFAVHLTHHRGPRIDYLGLAVAAGLSWVGVPGPGEAALIGAGVAAARGHLDIGSVLIYGWTGAMIGGVLGWALGRYGGRRVVLAGRWFRDARLRALEHGDRFFQRFGLIAVYFAPSWVAGINGMSTLRFVPANAVCALAWTMLVGLGSYAAGPSIRDLASDIGLYGTIAILLAALIAGIAGRKGWLRRRARQESEISERALGDARR